MGLMVRYNSLCVLRGLYGSVLVLVFPFASLWILIGSLYCRSLFGFIYSNGSL